MRMHEKKTLAGMNDKEKMHYIISKNNAKAPVKMKKVLPEDYSESIEYFNEAAIYRHTCKKLEEKNPECIDCTQD